MTTLTKDRNGSSAKVHPAQSARMNQLLGHARRMIARDPDLTADTLCQAVRCRSKIEARAIIVGVYRGWNADRVIEEIRGGGFDE